MAQEFENTNLRSDANLIAYYRLETVNDELGSFNLTNNGTTPFNAAKFSNGADFGTPNTAKYLSTTANLGIGGTGTALTMSLWAKMYSGYGNSNMFSLGNNTAKIYLNLYIDGSNLVFQRNVQAGSGSLSISVPSSGYLSESRFVNFMLWYDGTVLKGYVDGRLVGSGETTGNGGDNVVEGMNVGANITAATFQTSIIDDFVIFNRALTITEIKTIAGGGGAKTIIF